MPSKTKIVSGKKARDYSPSNPFKLYVLCLGHKTNILSTDSCARTICSPQQTSSLNSIENDRRLVPFFSPSPSLSLVPFIHTLGFSIITLSLKSHIPHIDELPSDVTCKISLKSAEAAIQSRGYACPRKFKDAWSVLIQKQTALRELHLRKAEVQAEVGVLISTRHRHLLTGRNCSTIVCSVWSEQGPYCAPKCNARLE